MAFSQLREALLGPLLTYNVTILSINEKFSDSSQDQSRDSHHLSLLVTILNNDEGIDSTNIKQKLQESLQMHSNIATLHVVDTEIYGMLYSTCACVFI